MDPNRTDHIRNTASGGPPLWSVVVECPACSRGMRPKKLTAAYRPVCAKCWNRVPVRMKRLWESEDVLGGTMILEHLANIRDAEVRRGAIVCGREPLGPARSIATLRAMIGAVRLCGDDDARNDLRVVCRFVYDVIAAHPEYAEPTELFDILMRIVRGDGE